MSTDSNSASPRPAFRAWGFWLPGLLLAAGGGLALLLLATALGSWGYGVVLGTPFAIGAALGYGVRAGKIALVVFALIVSGGLIGGAVTAEVAGLLCGVVLAGVFLGPVLIGLAVGVGLRQWLKKSNFEQRGYLPLILLFLFTGGLVLIEDALHGPSPVETVRTTRILPVQAGEAWDALVFYEEVRHAPPLLARIGLPYPLGTTGKIAGVGDLKTCLYDKGRFVKRIREYRPARLLEFEVVEQRGIEDRSVRLISGGFRFEPLDPTRTRVVLSTEYEPLLSARLVWRPFERQLARALHRHVLEGIELEARSREQALMARGGP